MPPSTLPMAASRPVAPPPLVPPAPGAPPLPSPPTPDPPVPTRVPWPPCPSEPPTPTFPPVPPPPDPPPHAASSKAIIPAHATVAFLRQIITAVSVPVRLAMSLSLFVAVYGVGGQGRELSSRKCHSPVTGVKLQPAPCGDPLANGTEALRIAVHAEEVARLRGRRSWSNSMGGIRSGKVVPCASHGSGRPAT